MTKLDCNVVNCTYNDCNCCKKEEIQVEGSTAKSSAETCCSSFCPKDCSCR